MIMSELRWHPFHNEWVITATHRQERTFFPPEDFCPLCPTKPGKPTTEIPEEDYEIAVFENKFPSLKSPPETPSVQSFGFIPVLPSEGFCEVVCYTSDHYATLADLPIPHIRKLVEVWKDRYEDLIHRPQVKYVYIFENKGREIGVTLSHPHGQIYAYPFVPFVIQTRLNAEKTHYEKTGKTLVRDWLEMELRENKRIVWHSEEWVALVPFFARYPYETHIVPKKNACTLSHMDERQLDSLPEAIKTVTQKLDRLFGFSMPYIKSLYQYPEEYSTFVIEFTPPYRTADKLKYLAGSEAGCGVFINDTLPEETAQRLREK